MGKYFERILVLVLFFSANSYAGLIHVNASADMSSGLPLSTDLLPIGTKVSADVIFDIGAGTINTTSFSNVSGGFSWFDSTHGLQTFRVSDAFITTTHSAGWFNLKFMGNGPIIDGILADSFSIVFDIGVNPFISPGNSTELYDLVLDSSISRFRVGAQKGNSIQYGNLEHNVTGAVNAVPESGSLLLFISGLLSIFLARAASNKRI